MKCKDCEQKDILIESLQYEIEQLKRRLRKVSKNKDDRPEVDPWRLAEQKEKANG